MDLWVRVARPPLEPRAPVGVLVGPRPRPGRPRKAYTLRLRSRPDVRWARATGVPVHLVTPELVGIFGVPMTFPDVLVAWSGVRPAIEAGFRVDLFESRRGAMDPTLEDLVVCLLRIDPWAARAVAIRNRSSIDPARFLARVLTEGRGREASEVRLQDVAPSLPVEGDVLPRSVVARQDRNNESRGLL